MSEVETVLVRGIRNCPYTFNGYDILYCVEGERCEMPINAAILNESRGFVEFIEEEDDDEKPKKSDDDDDFHDDLTVLPGLGTNGENWLNTNEQIFTYEALLAFVKTEEGYTKFDKVVRGDVQRAIKKLEDLVK